METTSWWFQIINKVHVTMSSSPKTTHHKSLRKAAVMAFPPSPEKYRESWEKAIPIVPESEGINKYLWLQLTIQTKKWTRTYPQNFSGMVRQGLSGKIVIKKWHEHTNSSNLSTFCNKFIFPEWFSGITYLTFAAW